MLVPAEPAVKDIAPSVAIEAAILPATPPEVVVVTPSMGSESTLPDDVVTLVAVGVASPSVNDSL